MITRLHRYITTAYRPAVQLPHTLAWAIGLTALLACATGRAATWRPGPDLAITATTMVVAMLLMRALDDIRDLDYDRAVNPQRPLPSGTVSERDLLTLVTAGAALLLLLNAGRGIALLMLAAQMAYTAAVIALDRIAGLPHPDRLALQVAVNLPIQTLLSLYAYAGFLRAHDTGPTTAGLIAVLAVTAAALGLELARKITRHPRPGERTYVTALGTGGTCAAALAASTAATATALLLIAPWHPGHGWGWLVLAPLLLPALAAARFAAGAPRWPAPLTLAWTPAMHASFLAAALLTKGTLG